MKYSGKNINVTDHNNDLRKDVIGPEKESLSFYQAFNMGYEGFSKGPKLAKMHPIIGNRGEFFFLALLFPSILLMKMQRRKNEEGIRAALGNSNNRWAHFTTINPSNLNKMAKPRLS